ncbi:DUF2867 domain-containing protein [Microbacterium sp. YY-01]|uniref:DUF2867 domain-containing protein n=1 Tax=Microbacterium sp. YY-01 TaxID=3421634 RepID=UPI003D174001
MSEQEIDQRISPPPPGLTNYRAVVRFALGRIAVDSIETSWVDTRVPRAPSDPLPSDPVWAGRKFFTDERSLETSVTQEALWQVISQIGGAQGWYSAQTLWSLRGILDRALGGVGLARARRTSSQVRAGDAVDVWRVLPFHGLIFRSMAHRIVSKAEQT